MNFFLSFIVLIVLTQNLNCTKDNELLQIEIKAWHKKQQLAAKLAQIKILNQFDMLYLVELEIGSHNKSYQFAIDTGSSDFLLSSSKCFTCFSSQNFDCKKSATCKEKLDEEYSLYYGDGVVEAHIVYDNIKLGNMISKHQSFLLADFANGEISSGPEILGLGQDELQVNRHKSLINNLIKQKLIKKNIFSVYLSSNYNEGSALILGGYNTSYFQNPNESIHWFPIKSLLSYEIEFDGIYIGDTFIQMDYQQAILDTGSSAMTFPENEILKIINIFSQSRIECEIQIEEYNTNYGILMCKASKNTVQFPDITFSFLKKKFIMRPQDYIYNCIYDLEADTYSCQTKLEAQFSGVRVVVLGDGFMHTFCTIFDKENQKIGIIKSRNENKILLTMDGEVIIPLEEIKKARAEKNFTKKSKIIVLGGMLSIPFFAMLLQVMRRKKLIKANKDQLSTVFGGIFLAASFCLCFYMTISGATN